MSQIEADNPESSDFVSFMEQPLISLEGSNFAPFTSLLSLELGGEAFKNSIKAIPSSIIHDISFWFNNSSTFLIGISNVGFVIMAVSAPANVNLIIVLT